MIRDKMFVISALLDESIKSQTPVYDVSLFKTFLDFENFIEGTPIIINTLIITTRELPFNNSNMARLMQSINSPFLQMTGPLIYIVDEGYNKRVIDAFMKQNSIEKYAIYQGTVDVRFVTDIITGRLVTLRSSKHMRLLIVFVQKTLLSKRIVLSMKTLSNTTKRMKKTCRTYPMRKNQMTSDHLLIMIRILHM